MRNCTAAISRNPICRGSVRHTSSPVTRTFRRCPDMGERPTPPFRSNSGLVRRLAGAIARLTNKDAEGRTWRLIPAEAGDKQDLLVVSLASDPDAGIADAIAEDDDEGVPGAARWDELGKRLLSQSRGDGSIDHLQDEVNVLVLRTVDPANRKAIYHRKTNAAEIWKAAERWKAALSNAPEWLAFPVPGKGNPKSCCDDRPMSRRFRSSPCRGNSS